MLEIRRISSRNAPHWIRAASPPTTPPPPLPLPVNHDVPCQVTSGTVGRPWRAALPPRNCATWWLHRCGWHLRTSQRTATEDPRRGGGVHNEEASAHRSGVARY